MGRPTAFSCREGGLETKVQFSKDFFGRGLLIVVNLGFFFYYLFFFLVKTLVWRNRTENSCYVKCRMGFTRRIFQKYGEKTQWSYRFRPKPTCLLTGRCWWHSGSGRVSHHCDWSSIPAPCNYLLKLSWSHVRRMLSSLTLTKRRRFSPGTPVSSSSNTEPMRGALTGHLGRTT